MSFTILSIYKLFFLTQSDILFALTKDGRILKVKRTLYFSALSSDKKILSGISFDGEYTHIFSQKFGFSNELANKITSFFGYFYYPALNANRKKIALIEADLLKPRPQGELPNQTEKNPKEQAKAVTTKGGKTSGSEVNNPTNDVIILDAGDQEEKEA